MTEDRQTQIRKIRKDLVKKLEWGSVDQWHSSMFEELSNQVFEKTETRLSSSTLKRFFGIIKYDGTPSITTLDALAKFLEFENWRAYKTAKHTKYSKLRENISSKLIYSIIGFFVAIVFVIFIANRSQSPLDTIPTNVPFSSNAVTNTYPNSVIFNFDLESVTHEDIQIQQYWDPSKTIDIRKDQNQATGIYYFPGYFNAKLLVNNNVVSNHSLFLRSNGWLGTVEYEPIPKYFTPEHTIENALSYPKSLTSEIEEATAPLSIIYHYINDLGNVSGDNFTLTASLLNTFNEKWAVCQSARIYIIGTNGAMIIPISKLGCVSDNNLMLNDIYLNGKENDMTAFGADLSKPTAIKIDNIDQEISIAINNKNVYTHAYTKSMGKIVGLRFKFLGLGEVASFQLQDQNGINVSF